MSSLEEKKHEDFPLLSLIKPFSKISIDEPKDEGCVTRKALQNVFLEVDENDPGFFITENHAIFQPARQFRIKWNIGSEQWNNFAQLLGGYSHFPIILLQNPAPTHWQPFEEMRQCSTISWLSQELDNMGLSLNLVPVLDVCSFFSDQDLEEMNDERRWEAVEASYKLLNEILERLRPNFRVVVCCQCVTRGRFDQGRVTWRPAENSLARQLCSSVKSAVRGLAIPIYLNGVEIPLDMDPYTVWCVQAFHPRYANFDSTSERGILLSKILKRTFEPCVKWYRQFLILSLHEFVDDFEKRAPRRLRATREMCNCGLLDSDEVQKMNSLACKYVANAIRHFRRMFASYGDPKDERITRLKARFVAALEKTRDGADDRVIDTSRYVKYLRDIHSSSGA